MNYNKYFDKVYDGKNYNCVHFVCEIWEDCGKGPGMRRALGGVMTGPQERQFHLIDLRSLQIESSPQEGIVAYMRRKGQVHVGIWTDGKILHLSKDGVKLEPLDIIRLSFPSVRFLTCKS